MKTIIPIGGGDIGTRSTYKIDKYIVSLANVNKPKVLFIPIASNDYQDYIDRFKTYYESLNCEVDVLKLSLETNDNLIRSKIFTSNIIYLGGVNTAKMMRIFKRCNVINYLIDAYNKGIILTGISAGAMAYFTCGYSDANRSTDINTPLCEVKCVNIIPYCFCPHYNESERKTFDNFIKLKDYQGIALEDNVALVYVDDKIKGVISSNGNNGFYITKDTKEKINVIGE